MKSVVKKGKRQLSKFYCWLKRLLWENPYQNWFLLTLAVINILGSAYGYFWYRGQLSSTPLIWWPFTPDSPLATTLFALAMVLAVRKRGNSLLCLIATLAVIKYGMWAVALISDYWLSGAKIEPVELGLWLSHLGMMAEGFIFIRHLAVSCRHLLPTGMWLGLNDFVDYGLGMHPYLFSAGQSNLALITAVSLSLVAILYLGLAVKWSRRAGKWISGKNIY